jgi:uridine nucleosidase
LIRPTRHDPEIHGDDGLGGVEGFSDADAPSTLARFVTDENGAFVRALDGMCKSIKAAMTDGYKVTVVSCGPCTNIALFVSVYPDLLVGIEQFVFMGGGVGVGNRSAVAGQAINHFVRRFILLTCRIQSIILFVTVGCSDIWPSVCLILQIY